MEEIWKDVPGYEGEYQISNFGRVKSLKVGAWCAGKILSNKRRGGYRFIALSKHGIRKNFLIHRLVGIAFIDNPHNYPQINHRDLKRSNNHVDNLEWVTHQMNIQHAFNTKNGKRVVLRKTGW